MSRTLKIILAINLLLLVALTFAWPHLLVAPGKLIPGQQLIGRGSSLKIPIVTALVASIQLRRLSPPWRGLGRGGPIVIVIVRRCRPHRRQRLRKIHRGRHQ